MGIVKPILRKLRKDSFDLKSWPPISDIDFVSKPVECVAIQHFNNNDDNKWCTKIAVETTNQSVPTMSAISMWGTWLDDWKLGEKKWDFRLRLKEAREGKERISIGIAFQTGGAEKLKARFPNSVRHLGMARRSRLEERKVWVDLET